MKRTTKRTTLKPVTSLYDLRSKAATDPLYEKLMFVSASNLGWDQAGGFEGAWRWLRVNAAETTEHGVVAEVNACRDLV